MAAIWTDTALVIRAQWVTFSLKLRVPVAAVCTHSPSKRKHIRINWTTSIQRSRRGGRGFDGCGDGGRGQRLWDGGRVVCGWVELRVVE